MTITAYGLTGYASAYADPLRMVRESGLNDANRAWANRARERAATTKDAGWWARVLEIPESPINKAAIEDAYRIKAKKAHPDKGGSDEAMAELNAARDEAMRHI